MEPGKRWEQDFKDSMDSGCVRIYDTTNGFAGVKNPCDFIYYMYPYQYMIELKSTQEHKLNFCHITEHQWKSLMDFNDLVGVNSLVLVEFREYKECYAIPFDVILNINKFRRSITIDMCREIPAVKLIPTTYKRKHCIIHLKEFKEILKNIGDIKFESWRENEDKINR